MDVAKRTTMVVAVQSKPQSLAADAMTADVAEPMIVAAAVEAESFAVSSPDSEAVPADADATWGALVTRPIAVVAAMMAEGAMPVEAVAVAKWAENSAVSFPVAEENYVASSTEARTIVVATEPTLTNALVLNTEQPECKAVFLDVEHQA